MDKYVSNIEKWLVVCYRINRVATKLNGGVSVMKFVYFNDTNRVVKIHPATFLHGCSGDETPISPREQRLFILPEGTYPWVKMWDYGEKIGLQILVSPVTDVKE